MSGRSISILAYGNTSDEIELYAIDGARKVLGMDVQLKVRRNYAITNAHKSNGQWMANVIVVVVDEEAED